MRLEVTGPCRVMASMLVGPAFECVHDVEITRLGAGSRVSLVVTYDEQSAAVHARYSPCAAVGMRAVEGGRWCIGFASNDHRAPRELLLSALGHTEERLKRALLALGNQPVEPPVSFC